MPSAGISNHRHIAHSRAPSALTPGGILMKLPRRRFLHLAAGAAAMPALSLVTRAQAYPSRPVTFIVPWPAGSTTDAALRPLVTATEKHLGQSIVYENRPGAAGTLAPAQMAKGA